MVHMIRCYEVLATQGSELHRALEIQGVRIVRFLDVPLRFIHKRARIRPHISPLGLVELPHTAMVVGLVFAATLHRIAVLDRHLLLLNGSVVVGVVLLLVKLPCPF